jgi:hypothetical protein
VPGSRSRIAAVVRVIKIVKVGLGLWTHREPHWPGLPSTGTGQSCSSPPDAGGPLPPDARQNPPPCRPRRDANARRCPHGRDISCPTRHVEADPRLGQPMCSDCYNHELAVLFNAYAAGLWRRSTTYLPRHLVRLAGVTQKTLRAQLRIRVVKVAEYQAAAWSTSTPSSAWTRACILCVTTSPRC